MTGLATPWSTTLGLGVPIVAAPMGGVAGGRFAHAVSRAGALGLIGMGSAGSAAKLSAQLVEFESASRTEADASAEASALPFGIGLVHWGLDRDPELLDTALAAHPRLVSIGFAEDFAWVDRVHAVGALAATQVYTPAEAVQAADASVDVVVARGSEGGGHGDPRMGTLSLLDAVLDAIGGRATVLAAGGVSSGRSLAAVLAAGADGAWVGTALMASPEALTPDSARPVLLAATGDDTVNTSAADAALGLPWPERFPERVVRNAFVEEWADRVDELRGSGDELDGFRAEFTAANSAGDHRLVPVDAGEGVGLLRAVRPVGEILDEFARDASALLGRWR
ncbi:nitronate monooxygenase [Agromyces mediolanus]|uniref:NAD(P)H-dependent flavin oxidoreductase n=1 Tax=Agromyces mediolanus TaxID=41986 RepID=UPI0020414080|nr:nitronate monooxygenase [Agromyces mediolanus]MCM3658301.1 nitronate monooxygenase [Agromyces mediolanus]